MRTVALLIFCSIAILSGFWAWNFVPSFRTKIEDFFSSNTFQTLEVRYSAEDIMEQHRKELLKDNQHSFAGPTLQFYPYLLMDVKYDRSSRTGEGVILWGMVDGEMVINASTWEKTHGFGDCLAANATRHEFKIINALAGHGGACDREGLSKFLNVESHVLDTWADVCRKKSLIVQNGNNYRLHLQNPRLHVIPETKLDLNLVTKHTKHAARAKKRFRGAQIEQIARAAFGPDFAIRKTTEVFLPVYSITVQNPDGTQMTTYWNALNGTQIAQPYFLE